MLRQGGAGKLRMLTKKNALPVMVAAMAYIALCTYTIASVRSHHDEERQRCEATGGRYELQQQAFHECLKPGERSQRADPGIG